MGIGMFFHHIGGFLLLVATALFIVSSVTSPVVKELTIFNVEAGNTHINFGTYGWCIKAPSGDYTCSKAVIGYDPASIIAGVDGTSFSGAANDTSKALTNVMILHSVGAGLCFIAFLLCIGASIIGSLAAVIFAGLTLVVTLVALICDFVSWGIIKHDVQDHSPIHTTAHWGPGIWCVLAAAVLVIIGAILVFITCCAGKLHDRRSRSSRRSAKYSDWREAPAV